MGKTTVDALQLQIYIWYWYISLKIREVFYDYFVAIMIESVNYLSSVVNASF